MQIVIFVINLWKNLITCDFVCHGVPSPKIFEEHRKFLENKYNSEAKKISFTYKINNTIKNMKVTFKNQKKYIHIHMMNA